MSEEHLKELRKSLETNKWIVIEELPGNDYEISGYWKVARPDRSSELSLAFEGLDENETLSIQKAYSCHVVGHEGISLYFGKLGKSFPNELAKFTKGLSCINT